LYAIPKFYLDRGDVVGFTDELHGFHEQFRDCFIEKRGVKATLFTRPRSALKREGSNLDSSHDHVLLCERFFKVPCFNELKRDSHFKR
jgi:hypothetical protein